MSEQQPIVTAPVKEIKQESKPIKEIQKAETPKLKRTEEIDYPFDISDVPENEISLAKLWLDDIVFDKTETENHNLALTYPVGICDTWNNYQNAFTDKGKTTWSGLRETSAYISCGITYTADNSPVYDKRKCVYRADRMPCRMWLCAIYKFLKEYRPDELARQREEYRKNKDRVDHEHLYMAGSNVADISLPADKMPFIPTAQIKKIRKLIDAHKYNLRLYKDEYGFEQGSHTGFDTVTIKREDYEKYVNHSEEWNEAIHENNDDGKNLERMQYLFIIKLLTQDLDLYHEYVDHIKKCEEKAEKLRGNSFCGYVAGNDRDEVSLKSREAAISISVSAGLPALYVKIPALEITQRIAKVSTRTAQYSPIKYQPLMENTIYLITGLYEFVKEYRFLNDDYSSPLRKQFEYFLRQMKSFAQNRYILLAGTESEINAFLTLDDSFRFIYGANGIVIEDKSTDQLYEIFKKTVAENSKIVLTEANEQEFKRYLCFNRGSFPDRNSALATFLADYVVSKGAFELPNDLADAKEKEFRKEFDQLVGMENVKSSATKYYSFIKYKKAAESHGIKLEDTNLHMLFSGNPGTGKTTVARILTKALYDIGIIGEDKLVEVRSGDLVTNDPCETVKKTMAALKDAMNSVLLINEAHTLMVKSESKTCEAEAIATLIGAMETRKGKMIVIFAGNSGEMERFLEMNPDIQSRIGFTFHFDDYSETELLEIFKKKIANSGLTLDQECDGKMKALIRNLVGKKSIGNGRLVDKLYQIMVQTRATYNDINMSKIEGRCIPDLQDVIESLPQNECIASSDKIVAEEKKRVAYREMGRVLVGHILKQPKAVKVTVNASVNGVLGSVSVDKADETRLKTRNDCADVICTKMAGLAAEKLIYGEYTSGGGRDLDEATEIAKRMIRSGMSRLGFAAGYLDADRPDNRIYEVLNEIINGEFARACMILSKNREVLDMLCEQILKKTTLEQDELKEILEQISTR